LVLFVAFWLVASWGGACQRCGVVPVRCIGAAGEGSEGSRGGSWLAPAIVLDALRSCTTHAGGAGAADRGPAAVMLVVGG